MVSVFNNAKQLISNGNTEQLKQKRKDVLAILESALHAVHPYIAVKNCFSDTNKINTLTKTIDPSTFENIFLVGFGKASIGMTQAICDQIDIKKGVIITNDTIHTFHHPAIDVFVGGHPVPNQESIRGTEHIIDLLHQSTVNDLVFVLISGGGSSLLCNPRVSLLSLQQTTNILLRCGANINEINTIRKHLSMVKGGQLLKHTAGTSISLVISDIVHDPLEFIASGPTYPDTTTYSDAMYICEKYQIDTEIPTEVQDILYKGRIGEISETPKPGQILFSNAYYRIVANNSIACTAALQKAQQLGYQGTVTSTSLTGEARDIGHNLLQMIKNENTTQKRVLIAGGETTVTVHGDGKGGRNQELVLGSVEELDGSPIVFASFATDGIDGKSDAAGAIADGNTLFRAHQKKINPKDFLQENNSYMFFKILNDLLLTGPSGTNVMDIQVIIN